MFKHIKLLCLTVVVLFSVTGCIQEKTSNDVLDKIKARDKIIIGTKYDSKPFGFIDDKQTLKGFEIDLARAIAKELLGDPNKVEFKQVLASNRILALSSSEVDLLIATMTITEQRKKVVDFSNPYFMTGLAILVPENSKVKTMSDLNNKPVIVVLGTTGEKEIRALAPDAKLQGFRSYTDGYSALKAGRAEAMVTDKSILYGITMYDNNFKLLPQIYTKEYYGIALRKKPESEELKREIDEIIQQLNADGTLKELIKKWGLTNV